MASQASSAAAPSAAGSVARAGMQDWFAFPLFIPADLWSTLRSDQRHLPKAAALATHLVRMGLRHPAERTQALVAAMVTGCTGDFMSDDISRQTTLLATVKSVVKSKVTIAKQQLQPIPGPYLEHLPNAFDALPLEMRQQRFSGVAPQAPVDLNPFWQAASTWPCRSTHTGVRLVRMQSQLPLLGVSPSMIAQHAAAQAAAQAAQALIGQVPAVNAGLNPGIPGFQLLPAGVEAAAAAAARAESTQSGQLQSLMDRAREPAGSHANQLALPAPQVEMGGCAPPAVAPEATVPPPASQPLALEAAVEGLALAHYGRAIGDAADDTAVLKKPAAKGLSLKKQPALPQKRKIEGKAFEEACCCFEIYDETSSCCAQGLGGYHSS